MYDAIYAEGNLWGAVANATTQMEGNTQWMMGIQMIDGCILETENIAIYNNVLYRMLTKKYLYIANKDT